MIRLHTNELAHNMQEKQVHRDLSLSGESEPSLRILLQKA